MALTRDSLLRKFYVDDGLTSVATPDEAIDLLTQTREIFSRIQPVSAQSGIKQ